MLYPRGLQYTLDKNAKRKWDESKMKKKYLALALAAVLAFGVAGCGGDTATENNNTKNFTPLGKIAITLEGMLYCLIANLFCK